MVEYKCNKCHKIFTKKYNYEHHLTRKFSCTAVPNDTSKIPDNLINKKSDAADQNNDKQCNYCNKTFSQVSSLNRHLNNRCSVKMNDINEKENIYQKLLNEINALKNENQAQQKQLNEQNLLINKFIKKNDNNKNINNGTINNGTINNIDKQQNNITNNVHINLVAHGKEDLSFITEEHMKKLLNKGFRSVENFVQLVHFDKNRPENHNIYISNIKDTYVMKYDGIDWKLMGRDNVLQDLYEDKSDYLVEKFEELQGKLDESTLKRFGNFLSRKDEDKIIEQTKREIKLILYNNRKIPEETRRLLKLNDENILELQ
ncbi:MAG: hypothetical protein Terrestrivirus2_28 [Terrestrivirus sp.]|uniref:C2H2-type domain-containing protein n=1 Tax=Terrestrivirus sp. TaxID=2487775 RepID=A0A3G4ZKZ8_9VIRU|nr:MAG: hypothetical protein Terrestrivirus2_28 [Terrestrivirus sp.]